MRGLVVRVAGRGRREAALHYRRHHLGGPGCADRARARSASLRRSPSSSVGAKQRSPLCGCSERGRGRNAPPTHCACSGGGEAVRRGRRRRARPGARASRRGAHRGASSHRGARGARTTLGAAAPPRVANPHPAARTRRRLAAGHRGRRRARRRAPRPRAI